MDNNESNVKSNEKNVATNSTKSNVNSKKINKKSGNKTRTVIVALFAILFVIIAYIAYKGNLLQVKEIGEKYIGAYESDVKYKVLTFVISFLWMYLLVYTTNKRIRKGLKIFFQEEKKEMPKFPNKSISFVVATITSVITSNIFLNKVILFINNTSFGKTDPIYGHDIGYYLFIQPFLRAILIYMLVTFIIVTLYAAVYYIILINTQFSSGVDSETLKKSIIKRQILNNAKVIVILIAALTFINAENLSSQTFMTVGESGNNYSLVGAGTTDSTIKVWGYRILSVIMIIAVFVAVPAYYKQKQRRLLAWIASVPVYLVALILVLIGYNKIFVSSNEYEKEKRFISYNIENTRDAYGINVDEVNLDDSGTVTSEELINFASVSSNINTNNKEKVLNLLNSTLSNKGQYKFSSTDIGLYDIDGKKTLVYITPREIASSENSYTNSTYENTHGYGVVVTSASKTDINGDLVNLQKDYSADNNIINVGNPRIYFGLETNKTIVTNSKIKNEFDYPLEGSEGATNSYDGKAGLSLNGFDKMILALSEHDFNLAFTNNLNENSKILTNRNVIDRAKKIMPYLKYDESPYLVVTDGGKLVWVIDAYTTSKYYPYSQKSNVDGQEINYIKNSVKVLIDAYDGDVKFYITDRTDLIAMAYQKAFPEVFMGIDEQIPNEISSRFNYPRYLYDIQSELLKRYHNTETDVIYRANDIWDIAKYGEGINGPSQDGVATATQMKPYYSVVKTVDSDDEALAMVLPYTLFGKQSLTSYLVGSYENGNSKLKLYRYNADNAIIGPIQLDTQINQSEEISKEIENLHVSGTKITKSIVLVPINDKIVYVEAIYQEYLNESNSLPKLRKVIVASGNKIAIGDDIENALKNLILQGVDIEIGNFENKEDIINSIIKANKNLKESTSNSDYEIIGKDINKLQSLIDKLEELVRTEKEEKEKKDSTTVDETVNETAVQNAI
ncbi:MAG: UPF0182 family protein [Clostridia bacterium]|nr:UPF0182 family protein [Clostridia bacterium]